MKSTVLLLLALCLVSAAFATSIGNVPSAEQRDMVIRSGLDRQFTFSVGGAERITATLLVPPVLEPYVTLVDPAPNAGPRTITILIKFPSDVEVPASVYTVMFSATEIPTVSNQVTTAVSISLPLTLRSYSKDPILEITNLQLDPVQNGSRGNFTLTVVSRTVQTIPGGVATVDVLGDNGSVLVSGSAPISSLESGASATVFGMLNTQSLQGGVYKTRATVVYDDKEASYDKSILRVGTLTIDLQDYTKQFTFNQTNKFQFKLKSNWNKQLTRVSVRVNLLDQDKRSAEQTISAFGESEYAEVYFDRTQTPPGGVNGTLVVSYQELSSNPALQDSVEMHTFSFPISVDVVLPPQPAKVKTEWHITSTQVIIAAIVLLLLINITVIILLFRNRKPPQEQNGTKA